MKKTSLLILILLSICAFQCEEESPTSDCIDLDRIRNGICTMDYNPVCGCDLKTYGNSCAADLAGVKTWTPGECK